MSLVTVKVMGTPAKVIENFQGSDIADLKAHLNLTGNYTAAVQGEPATDDTELSEGAYVTLSPAVKGA